MSGTLLLLWLGVGRSGGVRKLAASDGDAAMDVYRTHLRYCFALSIRIRASLPSERTPPPSCAARC